MKLNIYLKLYNIKPAEFASTIGATRQAVTNWVKGRNKPTTPHLVLIQKFTEGKVLAEDFYD